MSKSPSNFRKLPYDVQDFAVAISLFLAVVAMLMITHYFEV
ncbi:hypothetical protein [Sphingobacterium sp. SGG-5]|nr:hypothetical protein [Sphingobacterium sp. SGG-5]